MATFGFSVGDFVSALNLTRELIRALKDSVGSSTDYRDLIRELRSLKRVLTEVKRLDLDESLKRQRVAVEQAASLCQNTITGFLRKIHKFEPSLGESGSAVRRSKWRVSLRKMEWALYKKEEVAAFRARITGHTSAINMLLLTTQLIATEGATREQNDDLRDLMTEVLKTNLQTYELVLKMQTAIPPQVERQQPVYFLDACGQLAPFHLEFISSTEAFLAVLKVKFRDRGARKIERSEFVLEDTITNREIDLRRPWDICFRPGQRVSMSMCFNDFNANIECPACHTSISAQTDQAIDW
ncbi:uncharacterized protein BDZ99DRAFT_551327 [Mytilinidion resinicola]|uniref:Ubiquitin-like domain-containing protein n=1 Tax=Mytilinidion resinicola TaxID=574789 RepID=A0A6A6Y1R0_9PEZI|nr:uncharacterized protein BDZ99DRAFT_551327 [Mytilinidion resinicola]KAF2802488.1 hypothetical protein BDZ99DRAFT_551327 [Mytilinidion resinicola]